MKLAAPATIRGEFSPIQTSVPGTQIVEHLPRMARLAQHYSIIRTLHHSRFIHQPAGSYLLTGVDLARRNRGPGLPHVADDAPALGSLAARLAPAPAGLPACVMLPARVKGQMTHLKGQTGGWLGSQADPMKACKIPNDRDFQVDGSTPADDMPPDRLAGRRELLADLNRRAEREAQTMSDLQERAFELVASGSRSAFNLDAEPSFVRDRYGRSTLGSKVALLAQSID